MDLLSDLPADTSAGQTSNRTQKKRKASSGQKADSSRKKQKAQPLPPCTRTRAKKKAQSTDGEGDPEHAPEVSLALPAGLPPISSNIRAALCDSIQYWRAHQGGIQSKDKVATGMLLNGKTTPRDIVGAQVIVTTVGGGLKSGSDGKHIRVEDQSDEGKNYIALTNAMTLRQPIGIIVGKQSLGKKDKYANNLLGVKLDYHYNVLDFFFITDMWSERQPTQRDGTSFMHYAIRLQRIDLYSTAWWVPQGHERDGMHAIDEVSCRKRTCLFCNSPSKEIFKEGWCCLVPTCPTFFFFSKPDVNINTLQYNEEFLNERVEWNSKRELPSLVPKIPSLGPEYYGSEALFKGGIICPTCKFASRRISWEGWRCEKGCGFKLPMPPRDVPMVVIHHEVKKAMGKKTKFYEIDPRIALAEHNVAGYKVTSFYLPNTPENLHEAEFIGSVTVFRPTKYTLERKGGLDDLFYEMQRATRVGDVRLQRNPAFCRGSHKEELTSHFSCNMGADYKFGVVVETSNGFETAPDPVMKALSRLTWSGATAVALTADHIAEKGLSVDSVSMPNQFVDFNEQLMLGYFEGSQISYHDDGEKELGPTVATLSLGSPSVMRFRGKKKSGFENTVAAGNVMLSFFLEHGDIVIMHGTKIHKHYEHAVNAAGIRRYALTCRYIRPEMIPDPKRREKAIANGKVPLYWQKQAYTGEATDIRD
ncbi:hypothetical protein GGR51DRAFT_508818 [Nemania sp. FL0031]|nr:hypothetical protein GGR51DRAFT_508818 [Nemania sp. FL0031]